MTSIIIDTDVTHPNLTSSEILLVAVFRLSASVCVSAVALWSCGCVTNWRCRVASENGHTITGRCVADKMASVAAPKAFPRGGVDDAASGNEIAPAQTKSIDSDFLFRAKRTKDDQSSSGKKSKAKKNKQRGKLGSDGKPLRHQDDGNSKKKELASKLTFDSVKVGTVFLGLISKVFRRKLVVSLPHQLMGYVEIDETSDRLFDIYENDDALHNKRADNLQPLFEEGQYVVCVAIDLEHVGRKKVIQLSLRPSLTGAELSIGGIVKGSLMQGEVLSVEDYGYRVSLGPKSFRGFLPFKKAHGSDGKQPRYPVGKIVQTVVDSVNTSSKVVTLLGAADDKAKSPISKQNLNVNFRSLKPGMLVDASVIKVLSNGVKTVFLRSFEATLQKLHLSRPGRKYSPGDSFRARILFVDYANKDIGLSQADHVLRLGAPAATKYKFGDFCFDSRVTDVQRNNGIFARVYPSKTKTNYENEPRSIVNPSEEDVAEGVAERAREASGEAESDDVPPIGHVHISAIADKRIRVLKAGKFKPGQIISKSRVVGHRIMDNIVLLSTQPSVLEETTLTYEDVKVGALGKGEVIEVSDRGVSVSISRNVVGFVPRMHLSDVASLRDPSKKYKVGKQVKFRVLTANAATRKVQLTCKNSIVRSKLEILVDYQQAKTGTSAHGFVSALDRRRGVTVTFFGGISGVLPASDLAKVGVEDCTTAYEVGQVIACRVVECRGKRLRLSLESLGQDGVSRVLAELKARQESAQAIRDRAPAVGSLVQGVVLEGSTDEVMLIDIGANASDNSGEPVVGMLSIQHVTDHRSLAQDVFDSYVVGDSVEDLLVLSPANPKKSPGGALVNLTRKSALVAAIARRDSFVEKCPSSVDDVTVGDLCVGYITGLSTRGVYVKSLGDCSFFAPSKFLVDTPSETVIPAEHFELQQSVRFKIVQIFDNDNTGQKRAVVSLRRSDVDCVSDSVNSKKESTLHAVFLQSRLDDERGIFLADLAHEMQRQSEPVAESDDEESDDDISDKQLALLKQNHAANGDDSSNSDESDSDDSDDEADESGPNPALRGITIGSVVTGTIFDVKPYGVLVKLGGDVLALAVNSHVENAHKKKKSIGKAVQCRILYVDYNTSIVDASLLNRMVEGTKGLSFTKSAKKASKACGKLSIGDRVVGQVELLKKDTRHARVQGTPHPNLFAVVTLPKQYNAVSIALLSSFNATGSDELAQLEHGASSKFVVVGNISYGPQQTDKMVVVVPEAIAFPTVTDAPRKKRARSNSGSDLHAAKSSSGHRSAASLNVGSIVEVRIKKIFKREMQVQIVKVQGIAVGTVHITDVLDSTAVSAKATATQSESLDSFGKFSVGDYVEARIIEKLDVVEQGNTAGEAKKAKKSSTKAVKDSEVTPVYQFALSLRPAEVGDGVTEDSPLQSRVSWSAVSKSADASTDGASPSSEIAPGSVLVGIVTDIYGDAAQVGICC